METLVKTEYGSRGIMYGFLTDEEVEALDSGLDENHIIISHVGDGEYSHNVFGNAFTNYSQALKSYRLTKGNLTYVRKENNLTCIIQRTYLDNGRTEFYVGYVRGDWKDGGKVYPSLIGLLTVERLNSLIFCEGH